MQYLLLARHGNTFAPNDKVVWVGSSHDLPLVGSGIKQADNLSQALLNASLVPEAIYAGPLKRTLSYAQFVHNRLNLNVGISIDNRLHEIDYGQWSGLTDEEIKFQFGLDEFDQWQKQGGWPASFGSSEKEIITQVLSFIDDTIIGQPNKLFTLATTSNGRLKYFLKLVPDLWTEFTSTSKWKVSTGRVSLLALNHSTWSVVAWNESPAEACALIKDSLKASAGNT